MRHHVNLQILTFFLAFLTPNILAQSRSLIQIQEVIIHPKILKLQEQATLTCKVANFDPNLALVRWVKDSSMLLISENDQIKVDWESGIDDNLKQKKYVINVGGTSEVKDFVLKINDLQINDNGRYSCQIYISGLSEIPKVSRELTVVVPPRIDRNQCSDHQMVVALGADLKLKCVASGTPTPNITWQIEGQGKTFRDGKQSKEGQEIMLYDVRTEDAGQYRCSARNGVDPEHYIETYYIITVHVLSKPIVTRLRAQEGQAANRNYQASLECKIAGYPSPSTFWFKVKNKTLSANENIDPDSRLGDCNEDWVVERYLQESSTHKVEVGQSSPNLAFGEYFTKLRIINVKSSDYGMYACAAKNERGANCDIINLYETVECQGQSCSKHNYDLYQASSEQFVFQSCLLFLLAMLS